MFIWFYSQFRFLLHFSSFPYVHQDMGPKTLALKNARSRFDPSHHISDHAVIVDEQPLPFPISLLSFTPEALSSRISDFANKHRAWTVAADETGLLPVLFKLRDLYVGGVGAQSIMPGDTDFEVLKNVPLGRKIKVWAGIMDGSGPATVLAVRVGGGDAAQDQR